MSDDDLRQVYDAIIDDPSLFESIVSAYIEVHPSATEDEIHIYILELAAQELEEEADQEKEKRRREIARDRAITKTLRHLPDGSKSIPSLQISEISSKITSSSTYSDKEAMAYHLSSIVSTQTERIQKLKTARDELIEGEK